VTLLVDTLDLLLNNDSVAGLSAWLETCLDIGRVVVTCREREFRDYLEDAHLSAPRLAGRLARLILPPLTSGEVILWTRTYLHEHHDVDDANSQAFLARGFHEVVH
jgi:hypothetical protein